MSVQHHDRNKRSEAALYRWFLNALGGSAVAPLVAVVMLTFTTIHLGLLPAWIPALLLFAFVGLWILILMKDMR